MVPTLLPCTCGHWVSCGPRAVWWPQAAATGQGSGSHPSQCVALGLLWQGHFFLEGDTYCCLAVFLWLQVWWARPHFLSWKTTVGWYPLLVCASWPQESFCRTREFSSPAVASRTDNVSDRQKMFVAGVSDCGVPAGSSVIMVCLCVCAFRCCLSPRPMYWTPSLNRCVIAWRWLMCLVMWLRKSSTSPR